MRYRVVPARRAGMETAVRKMWFLFVFPDRGTGRKAARAPKFQKSCQIVNTRWRIFPGPGRRLDPRTRRSASHFPRKAKGGDAVSGKSPVPRRTRKRASERRGEPVAFRSRLFANTSSRGFPRFDERALTRPDAPKLVLREKMGCPQSRLADDRPVSISTLMPWPCLKCRAHCCLCDKMVDYYMWEIY